MDAKSLVTGVSLGVAGFMILTEAKKVLSKPKSSSVKNASPGKRNYLIGGNWKVRSAGGVVVLVLLLLGGRLSVVVCSAEEITHNVIVFIICDVHFGHTRND